MVPTDDCFVDLLLGDSPYWCAVVSLGQGAETLLEYLLYRICHHLCFCLLLCMSESFLIDSNIGKIG